MKPRAEIEGEYERLRLLAGSIDDIADVQIAAAMVTLAWLRFSTCEPLSKRLAELRTELELGTAGLKS